MSVLSYDINQFNNINNNSIFKEIEKLCNEPVLSLYYRIKLHYLRFRLISSHNKIIRINKYIVKRLYKIDYSELKEFESICINAFNGLQEAVRVCNDCSFRSECKDLIKELNYPLLRSFEITLTAIQETYQLKSSLFEERSDYKEYVASMQSLSDIWNYETPDKDKELVFNHNAKLHRAI
jgi:hypothetical protein